MKRSTRSTVTATATAKQPAWRENALVLAILYFIEERGKRFAAALDRDERFLEDVLTRMYNKGLVEIDADRGYTVTDAGRAALGKLVAMYDQVGQFEVFKNVHLERKLTRDEADEGNPNLPWSGIYDPRFVEEGDGVDMRLALIQFFGEAAKANESMPEVDPCLIVFVQGLIGGRFESPTFWFDLRLGTPFDQAEKIVETAYRWREIRKGDEEGAIEAMQNLYEAGMVENIKRRGDECRGCGTPLGMYEDNARAEGGRLERCPNPKCDTPLDAVTTAVSDDYRVEETVVREEVVERQVWTHDPGYYGYGVVCLDPFDPFGPFVAGACYGLAIGCLLD